MRTGTREHRRPCSSSSIVTCSHQRHSRLYVSENRVQRTGDATGFDGLNQKAGEPKISPGLAPEESMELVVGGTPPPFRLFLERSEGSELALRFNNRYDVLRTDRTNQLVLEIFDTDVKSQARHLGRGLRIADSGPNQPSTKGFGCIGIAEASQDQLLSDWSELSCVSRYCLRAADRENNDPFSVQIPPPADRKCFDSNLIADSLNQDDGPRRLGLLQGESGCLYRCVGAMHVASEGLPGQSGSLFTIHSATSQGGVST